MDQGHIYPGDGGGAGTRAARLVLGAREHELWFSSEDEALEASTADSFLLGSLLMWMAAGVPVHVHGPVTRQLLAGLEEWQSAWALWRPERYRKVQISVDEVVDVTPSSTRAVAAFSGGVDACFTARRHLSDAAGWQRVDLQAALLVHGFDVPLAQQVTFEGVRRRAAAVLGATGVELIGVRTNLRDLGQEWEDCFALAIAACLNLLSPAYGIGLIGSSEPYDQLVIPWGSNPVTDHLATTGTMDIRHDGAGFSRTRKVELLSGWPAAREHLRVCWQGEELDRNCGRCEKCIRTILNFRVVGTGHPEAFDVLPTEHEIASTRLRNRAVIAEWQSIATEAGRRGIEEPWVRAVGTAVRRSNIAMRLRSAKRRAKQVIRP